MESILTNFRVYGTPGPQGSKRHVGKGVMVESSKLVRPWRSAVAAEASLFFDKPLDGPVRVVVVFYLARPSTVTPKRRPLPVTKPDLDKLIRSTLDAMTGVAFKDDSQVISIQASKLYGNPGAWVKIEAIDPAQFTEKD
jgi:crossover junction endodeoxyribonuclease RusA